MEPLTAKKQTLLDAFQRHVDAEMQKDLHTTLETMTHDPHLNNIPTIIGGIGLESTRHFYNNLILSLDSAVF